MEPIQFVLSLNFVEQKSTQRVSLKVLEALGGKAPPKTPDQHIPMEGMGLKIGQEKALIDWNTGSITITIEELSNQDKAIAWIASFLDKINEVVPIKQTAMLKFTVFWILPTPQHDFTSLEKIYRMIMITKNEVSDLSSDSSTIFDIKMNNHILHHQSGAMNPQQLSQQYLKFTRSNIPKSFLFLETSIVNQNVVEYSTREMSRFMATSREDGISHSKLFENLWGGQL